MRIFMTAVALFVGGLSQSLYALTCAEIQGAGFEYMSDYFSEVQENNLPESEYRSKLLRKSVAAFHGDLDPALSDEEVNKIGEGVYFNLVKDPNGTLVQAVNVGFGGGNSAVYYYQPKSLRFVPVMSYDGDCVDQGSSRDFPIEQTIEDLMPQSLNCQITEGLSPVEQLTLATEVSAAGAYTGSPLTMKATGLRIMVENLRFDLSPTSSDTRASVRLEDNVPVVQSSLRLQGDREGAPWAADIIVHLKGNQLALEGRAYPVRTGGYWSEEAMDIDATGTCNAVPSIKEVRYHRIIRY